MEVSTHLAPHTSGLGVLLMDQPANCPPRYLEKGPESISLSSAQRDQAHFRVGFVFPIPKVLQREEVCIPSGLLPCSDFTFAHSHTHAPTRVCTRVHFLTSTLRKFIVMSHLNLSCYHRRLFFSESIWNRQRTAACYLPYANPPSTRGE